MKLENNIRKICEDLAEDLVHEFDKDKCMILNNLAEFVLPKKQREQQDIREIDNLKIEIGLLDYDSTSGTYKVHGGFPATNNKTNKIQPAKGRNSKQ